MNVNDISVYLKYDNMMGSKNKSKNIESLNNYRQQIGEFIKQKKKIPFSLVEKYNRCSVYNALSVNLDGKLLKSKDGQRDVANSLLHGKTIQYYYNNVNNKKKLMVMCEEVTKLFNDYLNYS